MTNPIIEKAETAAWNSLLAQGVVHDAGMPDVHGELDMTSLVRAVLQAIREPSEAMVAAGSGWSKADLEEMAPGLFKHAEEERACSNENWQAMIDAVLEEG